jgi:putative integral membrane protein (TIGR02587 family)
MMTSHNNIYFWKSLGRAFGGALLFALPLLMTMEMWWLGFYLDRLKIALFVVLLLPTLVGLSYYSGFRETFDLKEDAIDALVAFAVGMVMSAIFLTLFGVLRIDMSPDTILGKTILLTVPASIGAILASKQLGQREGNQQEVQTASYPGELFIMATGALLLAFNVAPTEEMVLIAYKMTAWHALVLALLTILIMHAMVYTVGFRGQETGPEGARFWRLFYHFTIVGYAIALLVSTYVLWTFGRFEGGSFNMMVMAAVVLAFPAGVGAAVSRLVV